MGDLEEGCGVGDLEEGCGVSDLEEGCGAGIAICAPRPCPQPRPAPLPSHALAPVLIRPHPCPHPRDRRHRLATAGAPLLDELAGVLGRARAGLDVASSRIAVRNAIVVVVTLEELLEAVGRPAAPAQPAEDLGLAAALALSDSPGDAAGMFSHHHSTRRGKKG